MVDRSNVGGGLGLVAAVAVVSTGIIVLASYHLHRRLRADLKVGITEQRRQRWTWKKKKKKKVRFADELVTDPSSDPREEYRRRAADGPIRPALRKA
ncbi:hypothetical protein D1007_21099 [Hordeum vulgare]|nr:hypothetical protein D1007_21099 [Hordeum vulgare]